MNKVQRFFNNIFTARNGIDYSMTKLVGLGAALEMMVKFWKVEQPDFFGFATGLAAIMAALAAKYYVEGSMAQRSNDANGKADEV